MRVSAQRSKNYHDFKCFSAAGGRPPVRTDDGPGGPRLGENFRNRRKNQKSDHERGSGAFLCPCRDFFEGRGFGDEGAFSCGNGEHEDRRYLRDLPRDLLRDPPAGLPSGCRQHPGRQGAVRDPEGAGTLLQPGTGRGRRFSGGSFPGDRERQERADRDRALLLLVLSGRGVPADLPRV